MTSPASDVRQQILQAATRLFINYGYHGLSMREIAEAVGVSKAGLYYHFEDKEALFLAILNSAVERLDEIMTTARQLPTVRSQITAFMVAIFAWPPEQRALIRLANQEMQHISQHAALGFTAGYHAKFTDPLVEMLAQGMARGELRPVDAGVAARLLLGMMYPFLQSASPSPTATREGVDLMIATFFDGLGA